MRKLFKLIKKELVENTHCNHDKSNTIFFLPEMYATIAFKIRIDRTKQKGSNCCSLGKSQPVLNLYT